MNMTSSDDPRRTIQLLASDPLPGEPGGIDLLPDDAEILILIPELDYPRARVKAEGYLRGAWLIKPGTKFAPLDEIDTRL